jgi:hypothetical protein
VEAAKILKTHCLLLNGNCFALDKNICFALHLHCIALSIYSSIHVCLLEILIIYFSYVFSVCTVKTERYAKHKSEMSSENIENHIFELFWVKRFVFNLGSFFTTGIIILEKTECVNDLNLCFCYLYIQLRVFVTYIYSSITWNINFQLLFQGPYCRKTQAVDPLPNVIKINSLYSINDYILY